VFGDCLSVDTAGFNFRVTAGPRVDVAGGFNFGRKEFAGVVIVCVNFLLRVTLVFILLLILSV
jgi:hypothetical protein